MTTNKILLWAVAGAAIGTLLYRYLNTEKGQELLNTATDSIKDLSTKATDYAKNTLGNLKGQGKGQEQFQGDSVSQTSAY